MCVTSSPQERIGDPCPVLNNDACHFRPLNPLILGCALGGGSGTCILDNAGCDIWTSAYIVYIQLFNGSPSVV